MFLYNKHYHVLDIGYILYMGEIVKYCYMIGFPTKNFEYWNLNLSLCVWDQYD